MYNPKDPFSLANPYSAVNALCDGHKRLGEANAKIVRDSAAYVATYSRTAPVVPDATPFVTHIFDTSDPEPPKPKKYRWFKVLLVVAAIMNGLVIAVSLLS